MRLAWDFWHKRIKTKVLDHFDHLNHEPFDSGVALNAMFSYDVTRDGHILNVNMIQKSSDELFNELAGRCIKSVDGDPILQFPTGSKQTTVTHFILFARPDGKATD